MTGFAVVRSSSVLIWSAHTYTDRTTRTVAQTTGINHNEKKLIAVTNSIELPQGSRSIRAMHRRQFGGHADVPPFLGPNRKRRTVSSPERGTRSLHHSRLMTWSVRAFNGTSPLEPTAGLKDDRTDKHLPNESCIYAVTSLSFEGPIADRRYAPTARYFNSFLPPTDARSTDRYAPQWVAALPPAGVRGLVGVARRWTCADRRAMHAVTVIPATNNWRCSGAV